MKSCLLMASALLFAALLYCFQPFANAQNASNGYYTAKNPLQLTIGLLAPNASSRFRGLMGFGQSVPAINIALDRARAEHLIDNVNFTFVWYTGDCNQSAAAANTIKLLQLYDIDAMIGPPCVTGV